LLERRQEPRAWPLESQPQASQARRVEQREMEQRRAQVFPPEALDRIAQSRKLSLSRPREWGLGPLAWDRPAAA